MKVGIVMPLGEQRGGGELMLLDLIEHGRNADIAWQIIFLEDGPMVQQMQALGVGVEVFPSGHLRELHHFIQTVNAIAAFAKRQKLDALVGWMWKAHLYSGVAGLLVGIPSLWYQLETPDDKNLLKKLANLVPAQGVVTLSKDGQEAQKSIYPYRRTQLVYPGVNIDRFNPDSLPSQTEIRRKLNLPLEVPLVGIVGRLQRWKGIHTLIEAMPTILSSVPETQCIVVGGEHSLEPEYPQLLKDRIAELNLKDHVILAGLQKNVPEWMQAMDVIVHASDSEPFGIVVVEAMALGKPLVAGASGGPTEIITPGVDGLLAPYEDVKALSEAILRYLSDRDFAKTVGLAARLRAQEFSTQKYAHKFITAMRELTLTSA